jgi:hypothetical protein
MKSRPIIDAGSGDGIWGKWRKFYVAWCGLSISDLSTILFVDSSMLDSLEITSPI